MPPPSVMVVALMGLSCAVPAGLGSGRRWEIQKGRAVENAKERRWKTQGKAVEAQGKAVDGQSDLRWVGKAEHVRSCRPLELRLLEARLAHWRRCECSWQPLPCIPRPEYRRATEGTHSISPSWNTNAAVIQRGFQCCATKERCVCDKNKQNSRTSRTRRTRRTRRTGTA